MIICFRCKNCAGAGRARSEGLWRILELVVAFGKRSGSCVLFCQAIGGRVVGVPSDRGIGVLPTRLPRCEAQHAQQLHLWGTLM